MHGGTVKADADDEMHCIAFRGPRARGLLRIGEWLSCTYAGNANRMGRARHSPDRKRKRKRL